jgi:hypothetical protein
MKLLRSPIRDVLALVAGSLLMLGTQVASAQAAKKNIKALEDVPGTAASNPARPACEIRAASGNSAVGCSIDINHFGSSPGRGITGSATFVSIDFAVPQPKGSEITTLGSLDGLARSYTLGMSVGTIIAFEPTTALFGMSAKAGPQSYAWYDAASLAKSSDTRSSYGVDGYAGFTFGRDGANAGYLRLSRQSVFKDARSRILCPSSTSAAPVECVSGPIGAPGKSVANVITLQYARAFAEVGTGMSVSISRNVTDRVTGVEVPIYLYSWGSQKAPLSLGISAGWSNDPSSARRGSLAVIFSTSAFKVLSD